MDRNQTIAKKYIRLEEASVYSGIPVNTLRLYRAQGRPPESFKIAGRVVYELEKFQKWIDEEKSRSARGSNS